MNKYSFLLLALFLFGTGGCVSKTQRLVAGNIFYSSYPEMALQVPDEFEYEHHNREDENFSFYGDINNSRDERFVFLNRKEKKSLYLFFSTLEQGYYVLNMDSPGINIISTDEEEHWGKIFRSDLVTFEENGECVFFKRLARTLGNPALGSNGDTLVSVNYRENIDIGDLSCESFKNDADLLPSQQTLVKEFSARSRSAMAFIDPAVAVKNVAAADNQNITVGNNYYTQGEYAAAASQYRLALTPALNKEVRAGVQLRLAYSLHKLGEKEEAVTLFEQVIAAQPDKREICRTIGNFMKEAGSLQEAEKYFKMAVAEDPSYGLVWSNLGWLYETQKRYAEMSQAFEKALKHGGTTPWNLLGVGQAYYGLKEYDYAEEQFRQVLSLEDTDSSILVANRWIGKSLGKQGKLQEALPFFDSYISDHENEAVANKRVGRFLDDEGYWQSAEKYLKKAVALDPAYSQAWNNLGWLYRKYDLYPEMKEAFEKAIECAELQSPWNTVGLARANACLQETETAKENYFTVLEMNPKGNSHAVANRRLAAIFYKNGNKQKAEEHFKQYIDTNSKRHVAQKNVGSFYYSMGKLDKAEEYITASLQERQGYVAAWNKLGWLNWKKGEFGAMRDAFAQALEHSKYPGIYNLIGLARANIALGEEQQAEELLKQAQGLVRNDSQQGSLNKHWNRLSLQRKEYAAVTKRWDATPYLGIHTAMVNKKATVTFIEKGEMAEKAGLQAGDILLSVAGAPFSDCGALDRLEKGLRYGDTIQVVLERQGQKLTKEIDLRYENDQVVKVR